MTTQESAAAEQFVVANKKDASNQEDSTEQQEPSPNDNDQAAAANNTIDIPPEIFLKGLTVLSPRQMTSSRKNDDASSSKASVVVTVPLPPLRPEEPVASIRSAISEVIGFAHLTKYRLVLEERTDGTTTTAATSSSSGTTAANGSSRKKNGKNNSGKNLNGNNGEHKEWEAENVVSTYTLEGVQIATDKLVQSLKLGRAPEPLVGQSAGNANGEEEELVLDDYGDLSPLLEVLEKEGKVGDPIDNKIIIDASNYAFRVVLERYDVASIRDHLVRMRQLLEGNAPHLVTLVGDEVVEVKKEEQKDEKKKEDGVNGGDVKVRIILCQLVFYMATIIPEIFTNLITLIQYYYQRRTERTERRLK